MTESAPETPRFNILAEAIEALKERIPAEIQERYFYGLIWNEIMENVKHKKSLHALITQAFTGGPLTTTLRKFLAAYLINRVARGLCSELKFGAKIDKAIRNPIPLTREERKTVEETIKALVDFVNHELCVSVVTHPRHNQPFVQVI